MDSFLVVSLGFSPAKPGHVGLTDRPLALAANPHLPMCFPVPHSLMNETKDPAVKDTSGKRWGDINVFFATGVP